MRRFYSASKDITPEEHAMLVQQWKWQNGQDRMDSNKHYKLIYDIDESWGNQTRLSLSEIRTLCAASSIADGCVFQHMQTGEYHEVVDTGKYGLKLHKMEARNDLS